MQAHGTASASPAAVSSLGNKLDRRVASKLQRYETQHGLDFWCFFQAFFECV